MSVLDTVKGQIVDVSPDGYITVRARYDDWPTLIKRQYKEANVQLIDSRPLSDRQRRFCYALIRDISEYSGMEAGETKEAMKLNFLAELAEDTAEHIFSLSNAPMSLVAEFQRFLVRFMVSNSIPSRVPLLEYVDDVEDYVYACLLNKVCCISGKPAELHHVDRVGMGRSRQEIDHEGMRALPLSREYHDEAHRIGEQAFEEKYHLPHGIPIDKTLIRIYRLGRKKKDA